MHTQKNRMYQLTDKKSSSVSTGNSEQGERVFCPFVFERPSGTLAHKSYFCRC